MIEPGQDRGEGFVTDHPSRSTSPGDPEDGLPRRLFETDVILEKTPEVLRLKMPGEGASTLWIGIAWSVIVGVGFWEPLRKGVPLVLAVFFLPTVALLVTGLLRLGRRRIFELGPDFFAASGLGFLGRTAKSWPRGEIERFLARDTRSSVNGARVVQLVVVLRSGKEEILLRSPDGLALGHIAVHLSKELGLPSRPRERG
jgi:hypothetical protein